MELPKNIIQIGKPDKIHKIFVEDYVVTYMKQLYRSNKDKAIGLAFYGYQKEEGNQTYYFLYGASVIDGIEHRGPYLSQTEKDEIDAIGKKYFDEYHFLAWCCMKEEPVESFFVFSQGKGIEIDGYACFYEKNESMLNYMLIHGTERTEGKTEPSDGFTRTRGEWTAQDLHKMTEKKTEEKEQNHKKLIRGTKVIKVAAVALFLGVCLMGVTYLNDYEKIEKVRNVFANIISNITEQKIPNEPENVEAGYIEPVDNPLSNDSTSIEDQNMINTVSEGNAAIIENPSDHTEPESAHDSSDTDLTENTTTDGSATTEDNIATDNSNMENNINMGNNTDIENKTDTERNTDEDKQKDSKQASINDLSIPEQQTSYTVVSGDTLTSICEKKYGSLQNIQKICDMNKIDNPDQIKIGQIILLP